MNFISVFPPAYVEQVAEHCPKAVLTYITLWKLRDKNNLVKLDTKNFRETYLISLAKFRHDLFLLAKECLINIEQTPHEIIVELVDWQEMPDVL